VSAEFDDEQGSFIEGPCEDTCDWCKAQARWVQSKFGPFIACSKYPGCKWTAKKTRLSATEINHEGMAKERFVEVGHE
jgi:ssDNA-binding Zn-finger/Zn-ribbon topoisomerase 1